MPCSLAGFGYSPSNHQSRWPYESTTCCQFAEVIAHNPGEFVKELAAFPSPRRPITFANRLFEFSPCHHAQPPRRWREREIMTG
jgi:hypothetical protein